MPRISPFSGLLFDEARIGSLAAVTAPPYDTVDAEQLDRLRRSSPYNIVELDLPEPRAGDDADDNQYTRARSVLDRWRREGILRRRPTPAMYPYEMRFRLDGRERTVLGLICAVELEQWGGSIVPHEDTMPGPVEDRLRLLRSVGANLSAVYAIYAGPRAELAGFLRAASATPPALELVDEEGVRHRMWIAEEPPPDLPTSETLLIADGHHRYTTALRYREEMRRSRGSGPWDQQMMFLVESASQDPPVLPIHRALVEGPPPPPGERVRDLEQLIAALDDEALTYGTVRWRDGRVVHELGRLDGEPPTVCALTASVGGLDDPRAIRFTHDAVDAEEAVRTRRASFAYVLPPTSAERIRAVIEARRRMPQKSTYFWPKPRTGTVLRPLE